MRVDLCERVARVFVLLRETPTTDEIDVYFHQWGRGVLPTREEYDLVYAIYQDLTSEA